MLTLDRPVRRVRSASRVGGRGRLLFGLRRLLVRTEQFAELRAESAGDRLWAATFADGLDAVYQTAIAAPGAAAALDAVTERRLRSRKTATPCR